MRGAPRATRYVPARSDPGPQPRDLADFGGEEWREMLPIEIDGESHFVPIQGLTDEEVEERVVEYARDPEALQAARRPYTPSRARSLLDRRYLVEALATLALVAGILWWASRPHGWDAVSEANKARAEAVFSREAAKIAGHPAVVRCDTKGEYVGFVKEADGLAFVGGRARVPDAGDLRHALPARVQAPDAVVPAHRARDRRARARGVAPAGRERRGARQLLRLPERRAARRRPRPLGGRRRAR